QRRSGVGRRRTTRRATSLSADGSVDAVHHVAVVEGREAGMTSASPAWFSGIAVNGLVILTITSMCYYALIVGASLVVSRGGQLRGTRPRASVLVPLCGSQPSLPDNLEAFRAALGPGDELLVGALCPEDPAIALAREVLGDDERVRISAGSSSGATNPKIAILVTLERLATHGIIVLVDSDVRLDPVLLDGIVSPLANTRTGLATALSRT